LKNNDTQEKWQDVTSRFIPFIRFVLCTFDLSILERELRTTEHRQFLCRATSTDRYIHVAVITCPAQS